MLGHYGCGGVKAASTIEFDHGLMEHWLRNIRDVVYIVLYVCMYIYVMIFVNIYIHVHL